MSLKARIEAVVYASEEPVTLSQLAGLFAEEILASRQSTPPPATLSPEIELPLLAGRPLEAGRENAGSSPVPGASPATPPDLDPDLPGDASVDEGATGAELPLDPSTGEPLATPPPTEPGGTRTARQQDREVRDLLRDVLDDLIAEYANGDRGIEIREIAGGYRFATKPECHDAVRGFVKRLKHPMKLTLQALETLAVIAYKQPVTAPEVSEIRGVDSAGVLGSLMARKLITTAGRKQVIGRPILYKTTKEFLLRFGLRDLAELPSIEEFEKMAGELAETDEAVEAQNDSPGGDLPFSEEAPVDLGRAEVSAGISETTLETIPATIAETILKTPTPSRTESNVQPLVIEEVVEANQ